MLRFDSVVHKISLFSLISCYQRSAVSQIIMGYFKSESKLSLKFEIRISDIVLSYIVFL